ncbi:MAG: phospholipase D-like domain-containing protein [Opitutaceae bacterium]|jgi:phosphatidylserine/phosphatidylglycerophosphate/cardiolipin synthase-like enzyme|nr:phospholipase D-like domain-containing protein [Opitutaceae bacterium]
MLAYILSSQMIIDALKSAASRGIKIRMSLDYNMSCERVYYKDIKRVEIRFSPPPMVQHNKIMIFDDETVLTGSANFTNAVDSRNYENMILIRNAPEIMAEYIKRFEFYWNNSRDTESPPDLF